MKMQAKGDAKSELRAALGSCKSALVGIGAFSGLINLLMLTSSLFMLEVYDRVLPSRSVPTLVGLSILAAILLTFQALLEITRGRLLVRIGSRLDGRLSPRVYDAVVRMRSKPGTDGQQPVRDLDTIRSFLSSTGPNALFDLPWVPLYLAICFAFHTLIGVTALGGAIVLMVLTVPGRIAFASSGQGRHRACGRAQPLRGSEPAQRRGDHGDGDVGAASGSLARSRPRLYRAAEARQRRGGRTGLGRPRAADGAAIGGARRRRLSRHPAGGDRPESSSRARSCPAAPWRRSILRSPTGKVLCRHGRAGGGSTSCWPPRPPPPRGSSFRRLRRCSRSRL